MYIASQQTAASPDPHHNCPRNRPQKAPVFLVGSVQSIAPAIVECRDVSVVPVEHLAEVCLHGASGLFLKTSECLLPGLCTDCTLTVYCLSTVCALTAH